VRLGIHTGLVIVGDIGTGERRKSLALGETPHLAARLQSVAEPDTVVISEATSRLVQGYFTLHALRERSLKGVATAMPVFRVIAPTGVHNRLDVAGSGGLTPMVNREAERSLFLQHWEQVQEGQGRVIVLQGEAGIGKSRLLRAMRASLDEDGYSRLECRCLPYHQNSAWYPIIELWRRILQWHDDETSQARLQKLETTLSQLTLPLAETLPLMASLLTLPYDESRFPPLTLSSQQQRERTFEIMVDMTLELTSRQPVLFVVEDLHWADPSTLELLGLLVAQVPAARLCLVCTCRLAYAVPWGNRSYLFEINLGRLAQRHVEEMVLGVTRGKRLPADMLAYVAQKTDGVPLFVEELTNVLLETALLRDAGSQYELVAPLSDIAIPATLHDALMARLDRLDTAKRVAQLGATLGRQFSYDVLREVSPWDDDALQQDLRRLVDAELVFQRGLTSQATYIFKHSLVQEVAYHSLTRHTRQHYHQRTAEVLTEQFPEIVETQPELLAHHFTEAGLTEQALPHWRQAGLRAVERSAYVEASRHLTTGLELLATLPDAPGRDQQELDFLTALLPALTATRGDAAPQGEPFLMRAYDLCQQLGASQQLFGVLSSLWGFHLVRDELQMARKRAEEFLHLAQNQSDSDLLLSAHHLLGGALYFLGDFASALAHLEQGIELYDPEKHASPQNTHGVQNRAEACLSYAAFCLVNLGYPDQARTRIQKAMTLSRELAHPYSLAFALLFAIMVHESHRDMQAFQERVEEFLALVTEHGFAGFMGQAMFWQGRVLVMQGQGEKGLALMHQGLAADESTGTKLGRTACLYYLSDAYRDVGQIETGLRVLTETSLADDDHCAAEWYWRQGELLLMVGRPQPAKAETCLQRALAITRRQQAKWWELRAAKSLSRLWQHQGKRQDAYDLLNPIYHWFTEGFGTADLQEAKALLDDLAK
jgi:tetratricopeptide (TPR) repeat protein